MRSASFLFLHLRTVAASELIRVGVLIALAEIGKGSQVQQD